MVNRKSVHGTRFWLSERAVPQSDSDPMNPMYPSLKHHLLMKVDLSMLDPRPVFNREKWVSGEMELRKSTQALWSYLRVSDGNHPMLDGEMDEFCGILEAQLFQDVVFMKLNGSGGE